MKKIIQIMILGGVFAILQGCAEFRENYEFGDGLKAIAKVGEFTKQHIKNHCDTTDPAVKKKEIEWIRMVIPDYPEEGICPAKQNPTPIEISLGTLPTTAPRPG